MSIHLVGLLVMQVAAQPPPVNFSLTPELIGAILLGLAALVTALGTATGKILSSLHRLNTKTDTIKALVNGTAHEQARKVDEMLARIESLNNQLTNERAETRLGGTHRRHTDEPIP